MSLPLFVKEYIFLDNGYQYFLIKEYAFIFEEKCSWIQNFWQAVSFRTLKTSLCFMTTVSDKQQADSLIVVS